MQVGMRTVPGQRVDEAELALRRVLEEVGRGSNLPVRAEVELLGSVPALATDRDHPLVQATLDAVEAGRGTRPSIAGFSGGTEAAILCPAFQLPMVIFGPGSLEQAHQTNEYVEVGELAVAARAYVLIAEKLLG